MHTSHAARDLSAPASTVYAYLTDNDNLTTIMKPLRFEHESDGGDGSATGIGSVRKVSMGGLLPFYERIEKAEPGQRIEYRIIKGSPMRNHRGTILLSDREGGGSHIDYTIAFDAAPGLGAILERGLANGLKRGLDRLEKETAGN